MMSVLNASVTQETAVVQTPASESHYSGKHWVTRAGLVFAAGLLRALNMLTDTADLQDRSLGNKLP